ncbi:hypothetical protein DL93DRAFT_2224480 [Clavulina sp. PMI_390]|nr:hypothetical protein DL93DRAFT_2224480 [Clavulina sp. PMI_390]
MSSNDTPLPPRRIASTTRVGNASDTSAAPTTTLETHEERQKSWGTEFRRRILNFTPSWFSVNMGTGIASILLKNLPYQFKHLDVIANAIFVLNVILFTVFFLASVIRYTVWPTVWHAMIHHPTQSLYIGTFPMGLSTIVNMVVFTCVPAFGKDFVTVAWVLWWISAVISLGIGIIMPFVVHTRHKTSFDEISGVWFLPIVTNVVASASGGVVATVLPPDHARVTLVVSYIMWGIGVSCAFFLMPLYYARLAIYKLPPKAMIVSVFLPVGPCGQGAFGLLQLASVVRTLSRSPGAGGLDAGGLYSTEEVQMMASAVYAVSIIVAFVLWGVGFFWLCNAVMTIFDTMRRQKIPFNMGWWGFTFPIGVFATATTALAKELNSTALRIAGTFVSLCVVLLWAFVASKTAILGWEGSIFLAPCLDDGKPPAPQRSQSESPATPTDVSETLVTEVVV